MQFKNAKEPGRHINIPIFIPHLGCPHTCIFCDQRNISGQREPLKTAQIKSVITEWLGTTSPEDDVEIAFYGGSFTGIPMEQMVEYLKIGYSFILEGRVSRIRISTRPDYINQDILSLLKHYHVRTIELGVQSLNAEVLRASRRGHTVADVEAAVLLIKENGFELGIQIMPGLPLDTLERTMDTVEKVIRLAPKMVRIYPAVVLKGTALEALYQSGLFEPLSLEKAVDWCAKIVPVIREAGIQIIKLGLHYSEVLEGSVVTGPFHPAFGELVEARILLKLMMNQIEQLNLVNYSGIVIEARKGFLSKVLGHKRINIEAIRNRYGFKNIRVMEAEMSDGEVRVLPDIKG